MPLVNVIEPETRTRVLIDSTAREGYRVKEICIELTNHDDPVAETSRLFHALRRQAERDAAQANHDQAEAKRFGA